MRVQLIPSHEACSSYSFVFSYLQSLCLCQSRPSLADAKGRTSKTSHGRMCPDRALFDSY